MIAQQKKKNLHGVYLIHVELHVQVATEPILKMAIVGNFTLWHVWHCVYVCTCTNYSVLQHDGPKQYKGAS